MPGLPQAPQGAGGARLIALEEDGGAAGAGPKGAISAPSQPPQPPFIAAPFQKTPEILLDSLIYLQIFYCTPLQKKICRKTPRLVFSLTPMVRQMPTP